jgi:urease alpha subunit
MRSDDTANIDWNQKMMRWPMLTAGPNNGQSTARLCSLDQNFTGKNVHKERNVSEQIMAVRKVRSVTSGAGHKLRIMELDDSVATMSKQHKRLEVAVQLEEMTCRL